MGYEIIILYDDSPNYPKWKTVRKTTKRLRQALDLVPTLIELHIGDWERISQIQIKNTEKIGYELYLKYFRGKNKK